MKYDIADIKKKLDAATEIEIKRQQCADPVGWRAEIESLKKEILIPGIEKFTPNSMQYVLDHLEAAVEDFCNHPEKYLDMDERSEKNIRDFFKKHTAATEFTNLLSEVTAALYDKDHSFYELSDDTLAKLKKIQDRKQMKSYFNFLAKIYPNEKEHLESLNGYSSTSEYHEDIYFTSMRLQNFSAKLPEYFEYLKNIKKSRSYFTLKLVVCIFC